MRLYDVDGRRPDAAVDRATQAARFLEEHGLAASDAVARGLAALSATTAAGEAFAGASHVQECVREDLALKREVFAAHRRGWPRPTP